MSRISIITPFYRGNSYMKPLAGCLYGAVDRLHEVYPGVKVEWLVVNDSPGCAVDAAECWLQPEVIDLPENGGIHHARLEGLKKAQGDYILFLDQDDRIGRAFFVRQLETLKKNPGSGMSVCNAFLEQEDGTLMPMYTRRGDMEQIRHLDVYLKVCDPIRSPGQCLIRREAIPDAWGRHVIRENGSDDLFLWILMLVAGVQIETIPECLYTHSWSGANVSGSAEQIRSSSMNVVRALSLAGVLSNRQLSALRHSVEWGARTSAENRKYYLKNPEISSVRMYWKIRRALSRPLQPQA